MISRFFRFYKKFGKYLAIGWAVFRNPRTPLITKVIFASAVGYFFSPLDILPEIAIPFVGHLDDLVVIPALFWLGMRFVPKDIQQDLTALRQG